MSIDWVTADLMPDACRRCNDQTVYHPHRWDAGTAYYTCTEDHRWARQWQHHACGLAPANKGTRQ